MLKIKNEVDLQELEKFGFRENEAGNYEIIFEKQSNDFILISGYDKCLSGGFGNTYEKYETLFDLIQAGLVEKVEE